jgi:hypothetical protein
LAWQGVAGGEWSEGVGLCGSEEPKEGGV